MHRAPGCFFVTSNMFVMDGRASQQLLGQMFVFCCPLIGSEGWTLLPNLPNTSDPAADTASSAERELDLTYTWSWTETTHKQQLHYLELLQSRRVPLSVRVCTASYCSWQCHYCSKQFCFKPQTSPQRPTRTMKCHQVPKILRTYHKIYTSSIKYCIFSLLPAQCSCVRLLCWVLLVAVVFTPGPFNGVWRGSLGCMGADLFQCVMVQSLYLQLNAEQRDMINSVLPESKGFVVVERYVGVFYLGSKHNATLHRRCATCQILDLYWCSHWSAPSFILQKKSWRLNRFQGHKSPTPTQLMKPSVL